MRRLWTTPGRIGLGLALGVAGALIAALLSSGDGTPAGRPATPRSPSYTLATGGPAPRARSAPAAAVRGPARPPRTFSGEAKVAHAVLNRELGPSGGPGQPRVMNAQCANGRCVVRYRVDLRGSARIIQDQIPVWKALFADRRTRVVTLLVHHTFMGRSRVKNEGLPIMEITCYRGVVTRTGSVDLSRCVQFNRTGRDRAQARPGVGPPFREPPSSSPGARPSFPQPVGGPGPPAGRGP